jgi:hypothetical protein
MLNAPDGTSTTTDDHDVLNTLMMEDLMDTLGSFTYDTPISMTIGTQTWTYELVSD